MSASFMYGSFGHYIRTVRTGHWHAQRVVAERVGIEPRELNDIEHDRTQPSPELLEGLAKLYYFKPGELERIYAKFNATALVAAVAALPMDDADREGAISSLRDMVNDYEFAVGQAGNLGGVELI